MGSSGHSMGRDVGLLVGSSVPSTGIFVGARFGLSVCRALGRPVVGDGVCGVAVGRHVGDTLVGDTLGDTDGATVGLAVGFAVGDIVGRSLGGGSAWKRNILHR